MGKPSKLYAFFLRQKHPRAWGRRLLLYQFGVGVRTPTCVGKTRALSLTGLFEEKHPHVRGEDSLVQEYPPLAWKHPHVRGEDSGMTFRSAPGRNTPTWRRGKTMEQQRDTVTMETPPRAWGRPLRLFIVMVIWETPPRAWGRQREAGKNFS